MKRTTILCVALCVTALLVGCQSELDNKPAAKVEATPETKKQALEAKPAQGAAVYEMDLAASKFAAVGSKVTADKTLQFKSMSGQATVVGDKLMGGEFTIQMDSVDAGNERLTAHLKSEDFFDIANHPTSTFKITVVKQGNMAAWPHEVEGSLTLRGKTKTISFPADITVENGKTSMRAEFTINRQDFGISYPGKKDDLIKDDVLIKMNVVLNKKG